MPKRVFTRAIRFFKEERTKIRQLRKEKKDLQRELDISQAYARGMDAINQSALSTISQRDETIRQCGLEITDLRQRLAYFEEQAHRDPVTSLYNRRGMEKQYREIRSLIKRIAIDDTRGFWMAMSLIRFDLDNFGVINKRYGEKVGDGVILAFAECLHKVFERESDILIRQGGDEFVVILPYVNLEHASERSERLLKCMRQDERFAFSDTRITASVGVAPILYHEEDGSLQWALDKADEALRRAKAQGKDTVCLYAAAA